MLLAAIDPAGSPTPIAPTPSPPFLDPIPGILPFGTLTVFAGAPGVGKTAMLADWIERWRTGRTIWGRATNPPTQFAYVAGDRHWSSHAQWFDKVGFPDIPHYSLVDDGAFNPKELANPAGALDLLQRSLNSAANGYAPVPGAHVFIDPVAPLYITGSQNNPRDVAHSLITLAREAVKRQVNITVVAHFGKQKSDTSDRYARPQDRIAGSYAFSGFSDTQIYLVGPEEKQPYYVLGWNPRHAPPQEFACIKNEHGLFVVYDVMKDDEVAIQVMDCFDATGPTSIAVIKDRVREKHGYSDGTIKRALTRLIEEGRVAKIGRGRYARVKLH